MKRPLRKICTKRSHASRLHLFVWTSALVMVIAGNACKKEISCESCIDGNIQPRAVAGPDQVITLPVDSARLDGSASVDPDGAISAYQWRKIAGPAAGIIVSTKDSATRIRSLVSGSYQFELTVTDNGGLSAKDTIRVTVNDIGHVNRPPVANAGPDQRVTDSVMLDGSGSSDPDNNIKGYQWKQVSGPTASQVSSPDAVRTPVTGLDKGVYLFELTVTDAEGLFSTDTVQVSVEKGAKEEEVFVACDNSKRPLVNAQLWPVTSLPAGTGSDFVVVGNKIYFMTMECPACTGSTKQRAYYNIYDLNTQSWSRSREHQVTPRKDGATIIAAGSRIFYAGGLQSGPGFSIVVLRDVDIYDLETDTWTSAALSAGGAEIAGAVVNNKVFFAGGLREDPVRLAKPSSIVDVYDLTANRWSVANLGLGRADIEAVTVGNKVFFAGGSAGPDAISGFEGATEHMDIYDDATGTWSVSALSQERTSMTAITVGNRIYWAGGLEFMEGGKTNVEISDLNTNGTGRVCLHQEKFWFHGKQGAALVGNDRIVFFPGIGVSDAEYNTWFDIYNLNTNSWVVGQLPVDIADASIFSHNGSVYVVGGVVNGVPSNKVWRLVF